MSSIWDTIYPKSCSICSRKGSYLCGRCKKYFVRVLPQCYLCRRISNRYETHIGCKHSHSLDSVFVAWEYNKLSSDILKRLKYGLVSDISDHISEFLLNSLENSQYGNVLEDSLLINIPISDSRLRERGFNQTFNPMVTISNHYGLSCTDSLLGRRYSSGHQALRDKEERYEKKENDFFIKEEWDVSKYKSISIVDDVVTTGRTLELATEVVRSRYGEDVVINAICLFRGKAYYSSSVSP